MSDPLWKLLELTIRIQLKTNPDAAYNTLDTFINTHIYRNPIYKERIEIIKKLDQMLINLSEPEIKMIDIGTKYVVNEKLLEETKDIPIPERVLKEMEKRMKRRYNIY